MASCCLSLRRASTVLSKTILRDPNSFPIGVAARSRRRVEIPGYCVGVSSFSGGPAPGDDLVSRGRPNPWDSRATEPLKCNAKINVGKLAGAIRLRVLRDSFCEIDTVGPDAALQAVKSVIFATRYLQETHGQGQLAFSLRKVPLPAKSVEEPATTLLRFRPRLLPARDAWNDNESQVVTSADSNPGQLAAEISKHVQEKGSVEVVGMGAVATSRGLKAAVIAETFLNSSISRGELLVAPSMQSVHYPTGVRWRVALNCFTLEDNLKVL